MKKINAPSKKTYLIFTILEHVFYFLITGLVIIMQMIFSLGWTIMFFVLSIVGGGQVLVTELNISTRAAYALIVAGWWLLGIIFSVFDFIQEKNKPKPFY